MSEPFKSRNGDSLEDLNRLKAESQARLLAVRKKLDNALLALKPLNDEHDSAQAEDLNVSTRLNIWWNEYRHGGASSGNERK